MLQEKLENRIETQHRNEGARAIDMNGVADSAAVHFEDMKGEPLDTVKGVKVGDFRYIGVSC